MAGPLEWDDEDEVTRDAEVAHRPGALQQRRYCLHLIEGPAAPRRYALERDRLLVGRAADADLRIKANSLSRHHALLSRRGPEVQVRDLNSRNGIYLNGVRVHSALLRPGDQLQLGDLLFRFDTES